MAVCITRLRNEIFILATILISSSIIKTSVQMVVTSEPLDKDIQALAKAFPGSYSNSRQHDVRSIRRRLPQGKQKDFLIRAEFYKMAEPLFNDSLTIYFQHFTKSSRKPFSSGFYSFVKDNRVDKIRMRIFRLPRPGSVYIEYPTPDYVISSNSRVGGVLKKRSQTKFVLKQRSCNMYWTKLSDLTYIGVTESQCLTTLGQDKVSISVSMTVSDARLKLTEGWYNVKDGSRLTQVNVPYMLSKKPMPQKSDPDDDDDNNNIPTHSNKDKHRSSISNVLESTKSNIRTNSVDLSAKEKSISSDKERERTQIQTNIKNKASKRRSRSHKHKKKSCKGRSFKKFSVLRNFRHIVAALTSGKEVNYFIDLAGCRKPKQLKMESTSFGGKITNFLYVKDRKSSKMKRSMIHFTVMKTTMTFRGIEITTREVTLLRRGHVEVKVRKQHLNSNFLPSEYTFHCRLYNERKSRGSVRISANPTANIRKVSVLDKITSLLGQGRDLRIVADVSNCQSSRSKSTTLLGGSISEYEITKDGRSMEVFLPVNLPLSSNTGSNTPKTSSSSGYVVQIAKSGDVFLTSVIGRRENGDQETDTGLFMSSVYRCKMSTKDQLSTNEVEKSSFSIFYQR